MTSCISRLRFSAHEEIRILGCPLWSYTLVTVQWHQAKGARRSEIHSALCSPSQAPTWPSVPSSLALGVPPRHSASIQTQAGHLSKDPTRDTDLFSLLQTSPSFASRILTARLHHTRQSAHRSLEESPFPELLQPVGRIPPPPSATAVDVKLTSSLLF